MSGRPDGELTHAELAELTRFLTRTCLEVERGLRPPEHLTRFMDRQLAFEWRRTEPAGRFTGGPVADTEIGPPHLSRTSPTTVHATVTTRTTRDRWGALTLQLQAADGRWTIADIQRVLASRHYRTGDHRRTAALELPVSWRIDRAQEERRLVDGALQAVRARLDELPAGRPRNDAERLERTWRRIAGQLDRELVDLQARLQDRQMIRKARRR